MHLMQIARSTLDDPVEDRTQSVVKPGSEKEGQLEEWLAQKRKHHSLAQKVGLDDPAEDLTAAVYKPGSVGEEGVTVWLAQSKGGMKDRGFVQMNDDLIDEYASYAEGDDDSTHLQSKEEDVPEAADPKFFS